MNTRTDQQIDFRKLQLDRVIDESTYTKSITFQGKYDGQLAVIRLDKTPFDGAEAITAINGDRLLVQRNLQNDIYSRYKLQPPSDSGVNDLKAIVVVPANETVLAKYSKSETVFYCETADAYNNHVEPFIKNLLTNQKDYNQWIYNILEGRSEAGQVILNDTDPSAGFILLPSLKSSEDDKDLHILAICHRHDLRSLRDLNEQHLPLLKNILDKGTKTIQEKYVHIKRQLRAYIHYHPTFYHFHVHFQFVDPSEYKSSDRDNLLTTVINNITLMPDYYRLANLTYPLSKASSLYKSLDTAQLIP